MTNDRPKPGYEQPGVGVIPEDWEVALISELTSEVGDGIHATPLYSNNGDYYFVNGNNLLNGTIVINQDTKRAEISEFRKYRKNLTERSILLSINGTIGNLAFYRNEPIILGKSAAYLNVRNNISTQFFYYALQTRNVEDFFEDGLTGTTIRNLGLGTIRNTPIDIPGDYGEQRSISQVLSDVDALIAGLDKAIDKKRAIKTATMQQLLTGKKRLLGFDEGKGYQQTAIGVIPEDWNTATLTDISSNSGLVRGPFGGTLKKEFFVKNGYKVYEQRNAIYRSVEIGNYYIDLNKFNELSRFRVDPGDLIVSCSGTIGCIYRIPENAPQGVINQALLKIRLNAEIVDQDFFLTVFRSEIFQERITDNSHGGAMQNLVGMETFKNTLLQLPPLKEQRAIATVLSDMDAAIAALESRLAKTQSLKQGMMQQLLTGKVRLKIEA